MKEGVWKHEPNESRVWVEGLTPRWAIPERIETNRQASSKVGVWIREVWVGGGENAAGDHLLELLLLGLLLLQIHGNGGSRGVEGTRFSQESERMAVRERKWSCRGGVAGQVECWIGRSCSDVEVEARHGCLCHQEELPRSVGAMGDRMTHLDDNSRNLKRLFSSRRSQGGGGVIGREDKILFVHNRFVLV